MVRIRQLGIAFLVFCASVVVADAVLLLLGASVGWLIGAGLLLTAPTVYRAIKLMDDVHIGGWFRHRKQDEPRLPRPNSLS